MLHRNLISAFVIHILSAISASDITPEDIGFHDDRQSDEPVLTLTLDKKRNEEEDLPKGKAEDLTQDPTNYLEKFGYLPEPRQDVEHSPDAFKEAVRSFQRMAGLQETGILDRNTREKMRSPRCGMPDMVPEGQDVASVSRARTPSGAKAENYYVPGNKWSKKQLTWRIEKFTRQLSHSSQRRAFYNAFKYWSDVTPLSFRESTSRTVDIDIAFAAPYYDHGDGYGNRFDGPGQVLAHAFYPEDGTTHFDDSERWTERTAEGTNLEIVATHEFGHALGLGHSDDPTALMAPFYQGYDPNFRLSTDDIRGIQSLYGSSMPPPRNTPRPPIPGPNPKPTKKPSSKPQLCAGKFDDVMQDGHGVIYAFVGKWMYKMDYWGVESGWPKLARKVFANTPPYDPRAVVYSWRTRYTYFFKKNRVQQYYGMRRIRKKTIKSRDYPLPQAAFMARDGYIYILSGNNYWRFDENRLDVVPGSRGLVSSKWYGIPSGITAAVRLSDGYLYFFKGRRYRKYNEGTRRVERGYPKYTAAPWMGPKCSSNNRYEPK